MKSTAPEPVADGRVDTLKEQRVAVAQNIFKHHAQENAETYPQKVASRPEFLGTARSSPIIPVLPVPI
jgi:hypothetical protein